MPWNLMGIVGVNWVCPIFIQQLNKIKFQGQS
jgi:hypothetical protein